VWLITDAATADGITQIFVEHFLALFLTFLLGDQTDFRARSTSMYAVAGSAGADVPALSIGVGDVSFLACALCWLDASLAVPYGVDWTGAVWCAVGFVADVGVFVARTLAWAELEGTAGGTDDWGSAFLISDLLHALVSADHVYAVQAWYFDLV
jgi:hypothetical protein